MANVKISDLPVTSGVADANEFEINESGSSKKVTGLQIQNYTTNATTVEAAGALMDSELTSEASVKALDQGVATTDSPDFAGLTVDTDTLYVDSANNRVGIGTSSPVINGAGGEGIHISNSGGAASLHVERTDGADFEIISGSTGAVLGTLDATPVQIKTNNSEAMRIDSSGNLLINSTSTAQGSSREFLFIDGVGTSVRTSELAVFRHGSTNNRNHIHFRNNNGIVGVIGTIGSSTYYNTSSDYRLKENVVDMANSIDRVKALPVRRFNFIADPDKTVDGFLAHEAQEIVPESVTGEKDEVEAIGNVTDAEGVVVQEGVIEPSELPEDQAWTKTGDRPVMQGIDQGKLVPLLTGALKEAIEKIESLEARIEALEAN